MREDLEYVLSQCLYSMRLEIFHRELPNMKGEQALKLKECHQKLISDLTTKMQDTIQDLFFETEIVESLNELNQL
ncbi:hypothetical protein EB796_012585 [Bugula neritina]|nr:hypothetical protein EB796_012585 [Bugula neritina]